MTEPARLDRDDVAVVVAGLVTLGAAWLPWYEVGEGSVYVRGWGLGILAVVGVLASLYAAGRVAYMRGRPQRPDVPVTPQAETFVAACLAVVLLLYRLLDAPEIGGLTARRSYGIVIALLAVAVQAVCAGRKLSRTGVRAG